MGNRRLFYCTEGNENTYVPSSLPQKNPNKTFLDIIAAPANSNNSEKLVQL